MYIHIMYVSLYQTNLKPLKKMKNKIKMSFIAAAAITAFAFTSTKVKEGKTYVIDAKKTTTIWVGTKITGKHTGNINIANGKITSDGKNITGGNIEFDMTSITNTDITDKETNGKLIGHLKSDDFFSVAKFPTAKFIISKVKLKSGNDYDVTGKLTIKGITNEITFPAVITFHEKTMTTIAKIIVNRTKFDIKYGSASFFDTLGDKAISDDFELNVNVVAEVTAL
jgi:polyisoprenoid-binding protein YceI